MTNMMKAFLYVTIYVALIAKVTPLTRVLQFLATRFVFHIFSNCISLHLLSSLTVLL